MNDVVTLQSEDLKIEIWTLGARLNGVWFQGVGSLVHGAETMDEALGPKKYNGAVVGPVANRIAGGTAKIGDQTHRFETNENDVTTLHSGTTGLHAQTWRIDTQNDTKLTLGLDQADGAGGFPGHRRFGVTYELNGRELLVQFEATTDAATWVNMALHPYWTLDLRGRDGLRLRVNADRYTPLGDLKIPTGDLADVEGTEFDLRVTAPPSTRIDHNFCLNSGDQAISLQGKDLHLDISTDAPGVQVYSGKDIGIAIEPQHWPDAMHHPKFPSILLNPGETYRQTSTYQFSRL